MAQQDKKDDIKDKDKIVKLASKKESEHPEWSGIKITIISALFVSGLGLVSWCLISTHLLAVDMSTEKSVRQKVDEQMQKDLTDYKAEIERRTTERKMDVQKALDDIKSDTEKRVAEIRLDYEKRIGDVKIETEKRLAELRVDSDRRFNDIQKQLEIMNSKLDSLLSKGLKP